MEPLADILAKLLADTAIKAAAPRVGDKLKAMTAVASGGAKGVFEGFQNLMSELAGIPEDLQNRLRNQWRRLDSATQHSPFGGAWDDIKAVVGKMAEHAKSAAAWVSPAKTASVPQPQDNRAPWSQSADEFAASGAEAFRTAQGSLYAFLNGQTLRVKSSHVGHDPNDVGLKRGSEQTRFVDPEDSRRIGMWNTLSANGKRIFEEAGQLLLTSINAKTGKRGLDERIEIKSLVPQVGLAPVELWSKSSKDGGWKGNHPGNAINGFEDVRAAHSELVAAAIKAGKIPDHGSVTSEPQEQSIPDRPWWMALSGRNSQQDQSQSTKSNDQPRDERGRFVKRNSQPEPSASPTANNTHREPGLIAKALSWFFNGSDDDQRYGRLPPAGRAVQRIGDIASPRLGAIAGGIAAAGPEAAIPAAMVATTAALIAMPKIIKEFGERLAEANRELADFSPEIASAYAQFDQAAFMRRLELARGTSGTAAMATAEWTRTLDSIQGPLKALATGVNLWSSGMAVISRNVPMIVRLFTGLPIDQLMPLLDSMQKDIEKMANGNPQGSDWGNQLTALMSAQRLPGRQPVPPPLPPIGGGK